MYYTYMLRCQDDSIYTGITTNVERRFEEHILKKEKCAKYTRYHEVKKIESVWQSENRVLASKLEFHIKALSKKQKEDLILNNNLEELLSEKVDCSKYVRLEGDKNFKIEDIECYDKKHYKEFVKYLLSIQDLEYKEFHSSLVLNSKYEMIGIRVPVMRDIAKKIAKGNIEKFLEYAQDRYYEEVMIQGLVISHIKDEKMFNKYFKSYINKIDNWALCDSFCSSIKIIRKFEEKYFKEAIKLALNEDEFISRVGIVIILDHFINQNNLNTIFDTLNKINSDKFYINMAEAWLLCEMYIKFPKSTTEFLKKNNLNKFTQNKAISKIHDSYRVSREEKELLNIYRK